MLNYHDLFGNLGIEDQKLIDKIVRKEFFHADRIIFHEGDESLKLFQILRGKVRVSRKNDDGFEKYIGILGSGDYFGELGIIDHFPRSATITTVEDTDLITIDRDDFYKLIMQYPKILWSVSQILCERIRKTTNRYIFLSTYDEPYRVVYTLTEQAKSYQNKDSREYSVSFHELCNFAGVNERNARRVLRILESDKIIKIDTDMIYILNLKALISTVDSSKNWL